MALISCPECGKKISDKALNCPDCGFTVSESLSEKENIGINADEKSELMTGYISESVEDFKGVLCHKCGFSVESGNQYCKNCGSKVYYSAGYHYQQGSYGADSTSGLDALSEYKDFYFWLAAVVPLVFVIFSTALKINFVPLFIFTWAFYAVFIALDVKFVNKHKKVISPGFEAISIGLLPPIYIFGRPSKTNKKYAPSIVWIILFIIVLLISFGVIRIGKGVRAELLDYINEDLMEIQQLENDVISSHDSVIYDNYSVVYATYKYETIPLCQKLIEKAEKINDSIESKEIEDINNILIKYYEALKKSCEYVVSAYERGNSNIWFNANVEMSNASSYADEYKEKLAKLCDKYGVILYQK